MAIGDRHIRIISPGSSYTPSGIKELITNISIGTLTKLEMKETSQSQWIRVTPTLGQSPFTHQNPGIVLTSDITLRAISEQLLYIEGSSNNLLPGRFIYKIDFDNFVFDETTRFAMDSYESVLDDISETVIGGGVDSNGDLIILTIKTNVVKAYRINLNNPTDESGNYGRISGDFGATNIALSDRSMTLDSNDDIYFSYGNTGSRNRLVKLNPNDLEDTTGTYGTASVSYDAYSAMTKINGDLMGVGLISDLLYRINKLDYDSSTPPYGNTNQRLRSTGQLYQDILARSDGKLYAISKNSSVSSATPTVLTVRLVDPTDVSNTDGELGVLGSVRVAARNASTKFILANISGSITPVTFVRVSTIEVP